MESVKKGKTAIVIDIIVLRTAKILGGFLRKLPLAGHTLCGSTTGTSLAKPFWLLIPLEQVAAITMCACEASLFYSWCTEKYSLLVKVNYRFTDGPLSIQRKTAVPRNDFSKRVLVIRLKSATALAVFCKMVTVNTSS